MWGVWIFSGATQLQVLFQLVYHGEYENFSVSLNKILTSTDKFRPFNELSAQNVQENGTYTVLYSFCKYESVKKISRINYEDIYTTGTLLYSTKSIFKPTIRFMFK